MSSADGVDFEQREQRQLALRIGLAWIELRRGAAMGMTTVVW
jgi:hypothetical protein